jgi:hypothetical protein
MSPKLRSLIAILPVVVPVALVILACLVLPILGCLRRAAVRNEYLHGQITREEARKSLGDEVDLLSTPATEK